MADLFGEVQEFGGELLGLSTNRKIWSLKMLDEPKTVFEGQFIAENTNNTIRQVIGESSSVGLATPNLQFIRGEGEVFSFTARLFAEFSNQNVRSRIELLKSFARKDEKLKRSPIFTYNYGKELSFKCFVQSVVGAKGVAYDEPRQDGSLRGATFSLNLLIIENIEKDDAARSAASKFKEGVGQGLAILGNIDLATSINVPGGSLHTIERKHTVKDGETFESIAAKEYGSPIHGDILRRIHFNLRDPQPGDEVTLVVKEEVLTIKVEPQSVALKRSKKSNEIRAQRFADRGGDKTIFI